MRYRTALAALAALASLAAPVAAQSGHADDALTVGHRALSFDLPHGGGSGFGVWKVVNPGRSRGFFVSFDADYHHMDDSGQTSDGGSFQVGAGPRVRRYLSTSGSVAPFVQSGLSLDGGYDWQTGAHTWNAGASGQLALGAEWFAFQRLSVEGHTGITPTLNVRRFTGGNRFTTWNASVQTFSSGFSVQVYF